MGMLAPGHSYISETPFLVFSDPEQEKFGSSEHVRRTSQVEIGDIVLGVSGVWVED